MACITVIGYGNPLRGDDGLGWFVAKQLAERVASDNIKVLALYQLTPELADEISRSELVVFVDACCDQAPGHISCRAITPHTNPLSATTHHLDPSSLLTFTQALYGTLPEITILLTVGGESFGYEEDLSPTVAAAVPVLEQVLETCINDGFDAALGGVLE
ncbi:MAG TPA: hydrogenase maturation protease [Anaerolineae bacterium]|nr:hydrogenase maturation protease [Anaerolineae bacterium]